MGHYFKKLLAKAGLPQTLWLHDIRHSHATLMLSQGVPVKVVAERLGHQDIAVTLRVYGHIVPHMQGEAARALAIQLKHPPAAKVEESEDGEPPEPFSIEPKTSPLWREG